jgi:hypothetical protein
MKELLCKAFCDNVHIRSVPAGLAVSTAFAGPDGDKIGFYIRTIDSSGFYRIEDNGVVLPMLEASGFNTKTGARAIALHELLTEYGAVIDDETREFVIDQLSEAELPAAALKFVAFCLRVRDLSLMTETRVASTFHDDVSKMLTETIGARARIEESTPIAPALSEFAPDFVIRATDRPPLALYLGTSDARVLEALIIQLRALYEVKIPLTVVALLEYRSKGISPEIRQQAVNRLAAVPEFRGDEVQAVQRIADEALGQTVH